MKVYREKDMKKDKKVFNVKKLYRRTFLLIYDIISVIACSYLAILIRYNFELTEIPGGSFQLLFPVYVPADQLHLCQPVFLSVFTKPEA